MKRVKFGENVFFYIYQKFYEVVDFVFVFIIGIVRNVNFLKWFIVYIF